MKLGLRLLATVACVLCILVALFSFLDRHRLGVLLEEDLRRDALHLAQALATALEDIYAREGEDRALEILGDVDLHDDAVEVRWLSRSEAHRRGLFGGEPDEGGRPRSLRRVDSDEGFDFVAAYAPVRVGGIAVGAVLVCESLRRLDVYLAGSLRSYAATALALWATALGAAYILGRRWIVAPVLRLRAQMEGIGSGADMEPLEIGGDDELAELADGLNAMCEALRKEEQHRRAISDQLQHAERLLTVGKLAAGLAHEIGSPLHVISGRARRIARRQEGDPDLQRDATIIREQAERISDVTRKLLDFARRDRPARTPVDPSAVAASVMAMLDPEVERRGVRLELDAEEFPRRVELDPRQLEQVLVNLIMNGVDASDDGGVVRVRVRPAGDPDEPLGADFVVEDDGSGVQPGDLPHVFDPFFTTKSVGEGTGLGLSVVHGIVEDHGGTVELESEAGRGTRVVVHFPGEIS